jgi:3',5'-cyclic AMP phosphodiesterase CpdA
MVILAQVSDLHIDGSEERYLATLPRPVDAVLVTGDVAGHGAPVLVAMHHPPVSLGIPFVDAIRQGDGHRLQFRVVG